METPADLTDTLLPPHPLFADVAVANARGPHAGSLSYGMPPELRGRVAHGQLVWVPLKEKPSLGIVTRLHDVQPGFSTRPLLDVVAPPMCLSPVQLELATWIARATACGLYEACALFLPPGGAHQARPYLRLRANAPANEKLTPSQRRLVDLLAERGEISLSAAQKTLGSSLKSIVPALEAAGVIERVFQTRDRAPTVQFEHWVRQITEVASEDLARAPNQLAIVDALRRRSRLLPDSANGFVRSAEILAQSGSPRAALNALVRKGVIEEISLPPGSGYSDESARATSVPVLSPTQTEAWHRLEQSLVARDGKSHLLFGVTGSGKTELYLRATAWCLRQGRSAIVLVPEIALSSQIAARFAERFGDRVAVLHSALSNAERYAAWQEIASGRKLIVVGPRSALFAPVSDLGLLVLDEEHDAAYKQDVAPRYHARSVAEELARITGATLILGSATPAVETYWRAQQGEIDLLELPERVGPTLRMAGAVPASSSLELPRVDIVDMRLELHRGNASLLSEDLRGLLETTIRRGEQAILLLNRRGLATVVLCRTCGRALQCPYCDIPLVYHQDREQLICHRCDYREQPRRTCPDCSGPLDFFGAGTQKVEAETRRMVPTARVLRWDQDTVRQSGGHEPLMRQVEQGLIDVIVGTQMVAKGFDLPRVSAIGVINADTGLHLPDFRSAERTFSLLTQVAGRAGRRGPGARVIVQSYTPDHYAIQAASRHDYLTFFREEIDFRLTHHYPPYTRLVRYLYRHKHDAQCAEAADRMARKLVTHARQHNVDMDLLGPAPAFASRVRGDYQWQVILRTNSLEPLLDELPIEPGWQVDIDPQSLLS